MSETQVISAGEQWDQAPRATEPTAANLPAETFVRLMRAWRGRLAEAVDDALAFIGRFARADRVAVHLSVPGQPVDYRAANADVPADCWAGVAAGDVVRSGAITLVPVRVDREILGVLRFDHGGPAPDWPPGAVEAIRGASSVIGAALHRQAALDELDQSRQRYESVLNDVGAVIVRVDGQGRMSYVNRAWTDLTGIPAEEMIGKDALHHVHPDDRATAAKHMAEALSGGDDDSMREVRFMTRDGRERWMEVNGRAVFDEHGVIAGFAGTLHDVTERRKAALVANAARDRAEQAAEQAERASQMKSEFLSRMSHELRTPLNAILGFGQLLELGELAGEEADNLDQIMRAGRHLLHLINDSLDVARIETGKLTLSLEPVQLGPIIDECLNMVRPAAADMRVTLVRPAGDSARRAVSADRSRLKQVLVNLISNAVKYNKTGGKVAIDCYPVTPTEGAPAVAAARGATEHGWLRIAVSDTGVGIAAERMEDVFVPFERLGAEVSGVEGTGLGLALTKSLVDAMGGRITVSSVQGVGATFYVDLPAATAADSFVEPTQGDEDSQRTPAATHTVVYIEDNPSNVTLVRRILARRPHIRLLVAGDGAGGLRMIHEYRPDMVLLDLHLPQMAGAEVLDMVRTDQDPGLRLTPIIVVTADLSPGTEQKILQAGANGFIGKPIELSMLLDAVDRHLVQVAA